MPGVPKKSPAIFIPTKKNTSTLPTLVRVPSSLPSPTTTAQKPKKHDLHRPVDWYAEASLVKFDYVAVPQLMPHHLASWWEVMLTDVKPSSTGKTTTCDLHLTINLKPPKKKKHSSSCHKKKWYVPMFSK